MSSSENETTIIINDADAAEGFFYFGTSKLNDFNRLCKRIGGEHELIHVDYSRYGSVITYVKCKVPLKFLNKRTFALGKKRHTSPETALAAAERLSKYRKAGSTTSNDTDV